MIEIVPVTFLYVDGYHTTYYIRKNGRRVSREFKDKREAEALVAALKKEGVGG